MPFKIENGILKNYIEEPGVTAVTVPEGVTGIADYAFHGLTSLTEVHIPEGVTSIGTAAFYGCLDLAKIHLPESLKSIGQSAFYSCRSLEVIEIPAGVTSIDRFALVGCRALTAIHAAPGQSSFVSADGVLFDKKMTTLIRGGTIVTEERLFRGDILIKDGRIAEISNRADAIASDYHQKSLAEIRSTAAALQAQIAALDARISNLQMQVNFLRH